MKLFFQLLLVALSDPQMLTIARWLSSSLKPGSNERLRGSDAQMHRDEPDRHAIIDYKASPRSRSPKFQTED